MIDAGKRGQGGGKGDVREDRQAWTPEQEAYVRENRYTKRDTEDGTMAERTGV